MVVLTIIKAIVIIIAFMSFMCVVTSDTLWFSALCLAIFIIHILLLCGLNVVERLIPRNRYRR